MADTKADAKTERLVASWKKLHNDSKVREPQLELARGAVKSASVAAGGLFITTKLGTISLASRKVTDWEGLARSLLAGKVIDEHLPKFQKQSEAYVSAPREWGIEAKAAAR